MHPGGRPTQKPRSTLGQRLAETRIRAGISQSQLAEMLGTTQPAVAYWERNAEALRSDVIIKLTRVLDVTADELLGTKNGQRKLAKPVGKARQMFEAVSKLPRRQQEKVLAVLSPFVKEHAAASF